MISYSSGGSLGYTYDALNNIASVTDQNGNTESYTYDSLNQLSSVTRGSDVYTYTYDNGGNILSVNLNGTAIKSYTYGDSNWKDLLTNYNGTSITYNELGNPNNWRDGMSFTWSRARLLSGVNGNILYDYNADGLRQYKQIDGNMTWYYYSNGQLKAQSNDNAYIIFMHDDVGAVYGLKVYKNNTASYYHFIFNLQGDVIGILDGNSQLIVKYAYDEWGNILSITDANGNAITDTNHIANLNPIRYRGYYYDTETGFYYLHSRYYDPQVGRFINADSFVSTGQDLTGFNMFAYCGNNPINRSDPSGQGWISDIFNNILETIKKGLLYIRVTVKSSPRRTFSYDEKVLISTIAAEATVTLQNKYVSSQARQAMANVALNRVGRNDWKSYKTVAEVCENGFDGYNNSNYKACMQYLESRDGNNVIYEKIIWDVMTAYCYDITDGCQLYYTPATMTNQSKIPNWDFNKLIEVEIPGVDQYYEGRFYKYK